VAASLTDTLLMPKRENKTPQARPRAAGKPASVKLSWIAVVAVLAVGGVLLAMRRTGNWWKTSNTVSLSSPTNAKSIVSPTPATLPTPATPARATNAIDTMEVAQSVVVTHDLDYGSERPRLAAIMGDIERRPKADDGLSRTFAILEAFNGEVQPDGKIRVSLRVSTEKPGTGEIVFRRTGQSLWKSRITAATHQPGFTAGALTILFDDGNGRSFMVDGSTGPSSIFSAILKESGLPVAQAWPEGAERELTFIYSACGCPVKVLCRRVGERTVRSKELSQVIFPDDPAAVQVINRLMGW
jgi:hypothetical protein